MRDAYDFAKFFIKNGADSTPNTYDGNMKVQKLLTLANMVHLAKYGRLLFSDPVLAFQNGCVIEKVRLRYKNDYIGLKEDSDSYNPDFTEEEYQTLSTVLDIFGKVSARELSGLNHTFKSWNEAYKNGTMKTGFHDKTKSIVDFSQYPEDIEAVKRSVDAYEESKKHTEKCEIINGVTFYYDDMTLSDELLEQLEKFSRVCDDDVYSICVDDGRLVIY